MTSKRNSYRTEYKSVPRRSSISKLTIKERILIVCEGKKTEPNYINALVKDHFKIGPSIVVEIAPHDGTAPLTIVNNAISKIKAEDKDNPFTAAFCVFDQDSYGPSFYEAKEKLYQFSLSKIAKARTIKSITSIPCFELWLFLHVKYFSACIVREGAKSPGDVMCERLKALPEFEEYTKAHQIKSDILKYVDQAVKNSEKLCREMANAGSENPTTLMHELVKYIQQANEK